MLSQLALPDHVTLPSQGSLSRTRHGSGEFRTITAIHLLALQSILAIVSSIAKRFASKTSGTSLEDADGDASSPTDPTEGLDDELSENRRLKAQMRRAAELFNDHGYKSIGQLQALNVLPAAPSEEVTVDPEAMARFLRDTPGLDRRQVGAYLGRSDATALKVLAAYVDLFELEGLGFVEALRAFMESFVIPGEAQMISRIMEEFARRYYAQNPEGPIADQDAAFVLAFSIIMLNTDAHNPGVKSKMTLDQFIRNNRGINKGADFPAEYLGSIYAAIREQEIRIVSESLSDLVDADGDGGVNSTHWDHLVRQSRNEETASFHVTAGHAHGLAMFNMLRPTFPHVVSWYLESVDNSKIAERVVESCHLYARICAVYVRCVLCPCTVCLADCFAGYRCRI